jgi:hypothetical protein
MLRTLFVRTWSGDLLAHCSNCAWFIPLQGEPSDAQLEQLYETFVVHTCGPLTDEDFLSWQR